MLSSSSAAAPLLSTEDVRLQEPSQLLMPVCQGEEPSDEPLPFIVHAQMLLRSTPSGEGQILEQEVPASCLTNTLAMVGPHFTCATNPITLALDKVKPYFNSLHNSADPVSDALENVKPHFNSMHSSTRPFQEFCVLAKPDGDGFKRLQLNLRHYRSNYTMGFFALSSASVLFSPASLVAIVILTAVWMTFLKKKNEDPEWTLQIGSYELSKTKQWIILDTLTGLVLLLAVGRHLVVAALITSIGATGHAVMHPLPECITDTSNAMETGSLRSLADGTPETPAALENQSIHPVPDDTLEAPAMSLDNMD